MNITARGVLADILIGLDNAFKLTWWSSLASRVDSVQPDGEDHAWLGGVNQMQENNSAPEFDDLAEFPFYIKNVPYQCGFRLKSSQWRALQKSGKRGLIDQRIADQTSIAALHPGILMQSLMVAGAATTCYDGVYFFSALHPYGSGSTQSNIVSVTSSTPATPSVDLVTDALLKGVVKLWNMRDDKGNEINMGLNKVKAYAGPDLYPSLEKAVSTQLLPGGGSNVVHNNTNFQISTQLLPRLTGNKIQLYIEAPGGAPFIYQVLEDQRPEALDLGSEYEKLQNHVLFMVKGNYNVGYGRYQRATEIQFATA